MEEPEVPVHERRDEGELVVDLPDFRQWAPEEATVQGRVIRFSVCASFEGGRWEHFISLQTPRAFRDAMRRVGTAEPLAGEG